VPQQISFGGRRDYENRNRISSIQRAAIGGTRHAVLPHSQGAHESDYDLEELLTGGRVRIKTANADALKPIHDFLRFQIEDHHTGDTTDIGST